MAKPRNQKNLQLTRVSASKSKQRRDDGEKYRVRKHIDQKHIDLALARNLKEYWHE